MLRAELETVIRWDQEELIAHLWTAYEPVANRWRRDGIRVRYEQGSWWAEVPLAEWSVLPRRRRKGRTGTGRPFLARRAAAGGALDDVTGET